MGHYLALSKKKWNLCNKDLYDRLSIVFSND